MISRIQGIVLFYLLVHRSAGVQLDITLSAAAVVEDQTVVITCSVGDVTDKQNTIYLKSIRNSESIVRCYFIQNGSKCTAGSAFVGYSCNCGVGTSKSDSDVKQYTLTRVVSGNDVALWYCENGKGNRSTAVIISFNYGPHDISVSGNQAGFDADGVNELSLICSTDEMFGSPLITWLNVTSGSMIINTASIISYGTTDLHKIQQLKLIPHWFQDRNVIQCVVTNIETNKTVRSTNVTLDLIYPPMEAPVMTGNMDLKDSVQEGSVLDLTCEVSGGKPPVSDITIRCDGGSTNQTAEQSVVVGRFSFTVMRGFHKHNCTCSAEHQTGRYDLTSAVTVFVKYAPEVTITWRLDSSGTSVEVICSADGNPSNYNFTIKHFWGETYIREMRGELVVSDTYTVKTSNTYMDAGTYQCGVSNGIQGLNNDIVQTANTHIEVDVIPVLLNETQRDESVFVVIGKPVSLNKIIFSRARITVYTWMNEFGQNTTQISDLNITLNIYKKKVEDVGYKMTLMIPNVNETDLGVYTLKVCNRFGCDQFKTTIIVAVEDMRTDSTGSNQVLIPAVSGSVVAVVLIIIIVVVVVFVIRRRRQQSKLEQQTGQDLNTYSSLDHTNQERHLYNDLVENTPETGQDLNTYSSLDHTNQEGHLYNDLVESTPGHTTETEEHAYQNN